MSNPIEKYDALRNTNEFVFLVFYRGAWCPFCQAYLKTLESIRPSITSAGGAVLAVTAEPASELPKMRTASGYDGETLVDTEHLLARELKRRGLIDVAISERKGYAEGMVQPGVLIGGNRVGVVYSWAIRPATMNLGGAKDRPLLNEVWDNAQAKMAGKPPAHTKLGSLSLVSGLLQMIRG
ncbi:MAG: hypothetical protein HETSPECPRED_006586 [Heterodermia speciosa]|uniref:Alkyl hydroperoxide reductase subunit C/ Thiol specific antioxidant domain-containing protein n=1 Tax=Heterodermia speciosa TaxID=116794 RepID=A0A8H3FQY7_9LECA|nr:MAG: hypothetical protein HETSPECPRED_006586 [Heterodermia speciosa]